MLEFLAAALCAPIPRSWFSRLLNPGYAKSLVHYITAATSELLFQNYFWETIIVDPLKGKQQAQQHVLPGFFSCKMSGPYTN